MDSNASISALHKENRICEMNLNQEMRMLWEEHVTWTRLAILSTVFGLPDADAVTKRLLRNPKNFAAVLTPLYGEKAAAQFDNLLTSHLSIAAELVNAAKAGDTTAAAEAEKRWYANADEIADFLAHLNPDWSKSEWQTMLRDHLAMTKAEAVDMLTKNYAAGVDEYDRIEEQALRMADRMEEGIMKQFPLYFNKAC